MQYIQIATEDKICDAVAKRLIKEYTPFKVMEDIRLTGNSYLKNNLKNFYQLSLYTPVFLLTDLDRKACPLKLIEEWHKSVTIPLSHNLLFRVAVREIESWLLADNQGMQPLLQHKKPFIITNPDELPNPKEKLLRLALKSPKAIREELVKQKGETVSQGIGYNTTLPQFVYTSWCPKRASEHSESLRRACERLKQFAS